MPLNSANSTIMTPLFRKLECIKSLSDQERRAIESLPAHGRLLKAHQDILHEHDHPAQCCLIVDGWAYRYKRLEEGKRQIMSFHVAGDIPDLQGLHLPVMDYNLATLTPCTVAIISHANLRDLMLRFPGIGSVLWRDTLVDASFFREWMASIGRRTAFARIAHLFCELYLKLEAVGLTDGHCYELPPTQAELGDALSLSNVHINRVLKEMRAQGLITLRGTRLVIEDWAALSKAGEFDPTYMHLEKGAAT
jgi:CRP-like cAMP-binding protein